jgi:hypothetical protein
VQEDEMILNKSKKRGNEKTLRAIWRGASLDDTVFGQVLANHQQVNQTVINAPQQRGISEDRLQQILSGVRINTNGSFSHEFGKATISGNDLELLVRKTRRSRIRMGG